MNQYLIKVILIATVFNFARTCPEGQYYSKFLDSCSSCGTGGSNCKGEEDEEACKNACIKGPNVPESTPRDPETTPTQSGNNSSEQGAPNSTVKNETSTGSKPNDVTDAYPSAPASSGGTNRTIIIVGITCAAIALAIIIVLAAVYFLRRYIDQRRPPNPTEHEEMQMVGRNEDNQQVLLPRLETPFDLNKVDQQERESTV